MTNNEFIGKNSTDNIKYIIQEKKITKVLIFAGKNSFYQSGINEIFKEFLFDLNPKIQFKNKYLPEISELKIFIKIINEFKPELIIAVGGGAALDLAKISNCLFGLKNDDLILNIKKNIYDTSKKFCELVAIPTTAGSGAEATSNAVVYIENVKYSIEGENIKPDYIIIEPNLILSTPKNIANAAGMDAIAQALESLLSVKSNTESVQHAKKSLSYTLENFVNHITQNTYETAYKMSLGALYAGKAINISKTTAPHALSYPFTTFFNIKHGHAVNLTLNDFLEYNYINSNKANVNFNLNDRFNLIFSLFNVKSINELTSNIKNISNKVGLELNFRDLNIKSKNDIDLILSNINEQRLKNNPIKLNMDSIKSILMRKL